MNCNDLQCDAGIVTGLVVIGDEVNKAV